MEDDKLLILSNRLRVCSEKLREAHNILSASMEGIDRIDTCISDLDQVLKGTIDKVYHADIIRGVASRLNTISSMLQESLSPSVSEDDD